MVAIIQIPYQCDDYSGVEVGQDHGGIQEPGATVCPRQEERGRENHCKQFIHQKTITETETKRQKQRQRKLQFYDTAPSFIHIKVCKILVSNVIVFKPSVLYQCTALAK